MEKHSDLYESFSKEAPEVFDAFNRLVRSLIYTKGLDSKTKQLLYIGMKIVTGDNNAVRYHISMAKQAGATRDEIKDTFLITLTVTGLKGLEYLPHALELYDRSEGIPAGN
jgi:alkylhydroperoxidase/carboxymuconolactone decarboxylase family protein YurZ